VAVSFWACAVEPASKAMASSSFFKSAAYKFQGMCKVLA
jgi:hypothetical protein